MKNLWFSDMFLGHNWGPPDVKETVRDRERENYEDYGVNKKYVNISTGSQRGSYKRSSEDV